MLSFCFVENDKVIVYSHQVESKVWTNCHSTFFLHYFTLGSVLKTIQRWLDCLRFCRKHKKYIKKYIKLYSLDFRCFKVGTFCLTDSRITLCSPNQLHEELAGMVCTVYGMVLKKFPKVLNTFPSFCSPACYQSTGLRPSHVTQHFHSVLFK